MLESIPIGQTSDKKSIDRRIRVRAGNAAFPQRGVADYFALERTKEESLFKRL